jgi:type I restriction enzyme S subunit
MINYIKFRDLFIYQNKSKIKAGDGIKNGKYPFFTSSVDLTKSLNQFQFDDISLIFGTGGNASIHYCDVPFSVSTDCLVVVPKDKEIVDVKYVYYYLLGNINILEEGFKGAGLKHISKSYINEINIPLPSIDKQKQISKILNFSNILKEKSRLTLSKYNILAESIFIEMFGDPISNEKGWKKMPLKNVVHPDRIITYGIVQAGEHVKDGIPYIRTGDIKNGQILVDQLQRTSNKIAHAYKRSQLFSDDIIMSIRATVGTLALLPDSLIGANLTQGTARISPSDMVEKMYLYYYLKNDFAQNWLNSNSKGATFREITLTKLRELPVLVPPFELQSLFAKKINLLFELDFKIKSQIDNSNNLFNSIIQKAFNGELIA